MINDGYIYGLNIVIDDDATVRGEFETLEEAERAFDAAKKDSDDNPALFQHEIEIQLIDYLEDKEIKRYDSVLDRPRRPDAEIS